MPSLAANNQRYRGRKRSYEEVDGDDLNGYGRIATSQCDDDDDDDDLDRRGDPLSLEELDGWMNQINNSEKAAQTVMPASATVPLTDDDVSPGQQAEVDYLKRELGDLGVSHPLLDSHDVH